jgi:hypothetical protein
MGATYNVKCKQCGHKFNVNSGGGFFFHILHCDLCGEDKSIRFEEIGEPHLRYIKGLPGPYCVASSGQDQYIKDNYPGEPMSEGEYHAAVEQIAGACECGGSYKFDAPPRCPKCRSTELEYDPARPHIMYD